MFQAIAFRFALVSVCVTSSLSAGAGDAASHESTRIVARPDSLTNIERVRILEAATKKTSGSEKRRAGPTARGRVSKCEFTTRSSPTKPSSAVRAGRKRVWTIETMDAKLQHYQVGPIG